MIDWIKALYSTANISGVKIPDDLPELPDDKSVKWFYTPTGQLIYLSHGADNITISIVDGDNVEELSLGRLYFVELQGWAEFNRNNVPSFNDVITTSEYTVPRLKSRRTVKNGTRGYYPNDKCLVFLVKTSGPAMKQSRMVPSKPIYLEFRWYGKELKLKTAIVPTPSTEYIITRNGYYRITRGTNRTIIVKRPGIEKEYTTGPGSVLYKILYSNNGIVIVSRKSVGKTLTGLYGDKAFVLNDDNDSIVYYTVDRNFLIYMADHSVIVDNMLTGRSDFVLDNAPYSIPLAYDDLHDIVLVYDSYGIKGLRRESEIELYKVSIGDPRYWFISTIEYQWFSDSKLLIVRVNNDNKNEFFAVRIVDDL